MTNSQRFRRAVGLGLGVLALAAGSATAAEIPGAADQIRAAVLAAPEELRAAAQVLGYDAVGKLRVLRKGSNELICLADDPKDDAFSVACYHKSLEPFMARGRELRAKGVASDDVVHQRWQEANSGKLQMPQDPVTLYVLDGSGYDAATGTVRDPYLRFVIYVPWATQESTGLALHPLAPGAPWLMFAGTAGAHIMINPARPSDFPAPDPAAPAAPSPTAPPQ